MMLGIVEVTTDNRHEESGTVNFYNHRDNDGGLCICTNPASNPELREIRISAGALDSILLLAI